MRLWLNLIANQSFSHTAQLERHKEVETVDDHRLDRHRWDNFNSGPQYAENCEEILDTLAEFRKMWDRRLSFIDMA